MLVVAENDDTTVVKRQKSNVEARRELLGMNQYIDCIPSE